MVPGANPGAKKLLPEWVGPFEVTHKIGKVPLSCCCARHALEPQPLWRTRTCQMVQCSRLHLFFIQGEDETEIDRVLDTETSVSEKDTRVSTM